MVAVAWMLAVLIAAGFGYATWRAYGQYAERQRLSEERMASFVAQAKTPAAPAGPSSAAPGGPSPKPAPASLPVPPREAVQERLLFEAAGKAALAGEPVLAIQLYARLLSRYPQTALAEQARAAVAEQKKKLAKA